MPRTPLASPEWPRPVHTTVHQPSHCQHGLSPECSYLTFTAPRRQAPEPQVMAQAVTSQVTFQEPCSPATYHDDVFEDAEGWHEQLERVARFNQWDAEQKLCSVYSALEDGARTWFENRKASLYSWDEFRTASENVCHQRLSRPMHSGCWIRGFRSPMKPWFTKDMAYLFESTCQTEEAALSDAWCHRAALHRPPCTVRLY